MRPINYIIIHEADTPTGVEFTIQDIDQWHVERGFIRTQHPWCVDYHPELKACGYHHVITLVGTQQDGRHPDENPAACQGHNHDSINICLIGKGSYTLEQWATLKRLVMGYRFLYPAVKVKGHYQFDSAIAQGKTCPDFNVDLWMSGDMAPLQGHING